MGIAATHKSQFGQALLEWIIVATLAMVMVVWAAGEIVQKTEQAAAEGYAHWLRSVDQALVDLMSHEDAGSIDQSAAVSRLPVNVLVDAQPTLDWLKDNGWLSRSLTVNPKMPYQIKLLKLQQPHGCEQGHCLTSLLLLALPIVHQTQPHPSTLIAHLKGKAMAVTDLDPRHLQGMTYKLPNPVAANVALPLGTIGLLSWRSDRPAPYVRIHETRPVKLSGGLELGRLSAAQPGCHPAGLVMLDVQGQLRICREGRWQEVSDRHDHVRACLTRPGYDPRLEGLLEFSGLLALFGGGGPRCDCPSGFGQFNPGLEATHIGSVKLRKGWACLRL